MNVRRQLSLVFLIGMVCFATSVQAATASFGFKSFDATALDAEGGFFSQAGGHPDRVVTDFALKTILNPVKGEEFHLPIADGAPLRNVTVEAPPGLIGNPTATPRCTMADFRGLVPGLPEDQQGTGPACSDSTQVGVVNTWVNLFGKHTKISSQLYNLQPDPGQPALFGFWVLLSPVIAVPSIRDEGDYGIDFKVVNIDETAPVTQNEFTFWGVPASSAHDGERGERPGRWQEAHCSSGKELSQEEIEEAEAHDEELILQCRSGAPEKAFLTNPSDCNHGPFAVRAEIESWLGTRDSTSVLTHDDEGSPIGVERCDRVPFEPTVTARPSSRLAEAPSGLDFELDVPTAGLVNPEGLAQALLKKAVVTLPEGTTVNPASGEGMAYCTEAQYAAEKIDSEPGEGCPEASKLGSVSIASPQLEQGELAEGSLFLAQPDNPLAPGQENPFDSLVALYLVARVPERGVIVRSAGKVDLDPASGQITTTFDDLPQLPFSAFKLHFREGARAPLVTPPSCGQKTTVAKLYPYSDPGNPTVVTSDFSITNGSDGGACPSGGLPPFKPGLIAGSINNAAGRFSPFNVRLFRGDAEQEITHFSIKLPRGLVAKLAGIPLCPDAAIAQAKGRERIGGGGEEQLAPSCPAASQIGRTLVGAGVGSLLTYVPGRVYLAGPYHGAPISIVAITSGIVGPFDIGTVTVREALQVNPETGEVFIDSTGSDPIPHIVDGVTTHIRDLRTYVDRPNFSLNPTDCTRTSTASTVLGSGLNFVSPLDDNPLTVSTPFQAADCAALPFEPKLSFELSGSTRRGGNPALHAHLSMKGLGAFGAQEAAVSYAQVTLPHTEFLDNAHIGTVCTRVQFKKGSHEGEECPANSVIGTARAVTPILDQPLTGRVYLRSNPERNLPDLAVTLQGNEINVTLVGHTDSGKGGRLRNTFEVVPDAPVTSFDLNLFGGRKGLLENAPGGVANSICGTSRKVTVRFKGHNGRVSNYLKPLKALGCKKHKRRPRHPRAR